MNIKVVEKLGKEQGKKIVILAGVHGDEVCGVRALDNLINKLKIRAGKVTFIYANLHAIRQNKRFIEFNLNRCFLEEQPKEMADSLEGKTAIEIMPYLNEADLMLDIHASYTKDSVPFVICDESQIQHANIFNADYVVSNIDLYHSGSTDHFMNRQKKPGFCFECGYLEDLKTQKAAEDAIINFLSFTESIYRIVDYKKHQTIFRITGIYKNKEPIFTIERNFLDFEKLKDETLIGRDGFKEVYCKKGQILLFVRDAKKANEECFLIAEEMT